ncbi:uncharacterized protein MELLADRAFT_59706 [Melampsora larici-populina 98AG31]|uniref:Uncharacterized protein n=1 Tax=Melampsora larici-populina (strain 98AG31 / pathotype 3-4-7) TaxID=747676 RepID=F4R8J4_MELLP|nr:uncharacterized protein MELLADRAFT_59706 [Melampsora larici-populina 98AG31]EGG11590.1 hypothetical protein MELLADRAFT_59706 [Melampsora larici-populina 98AG31]
MNPEIRTNPLDLMGLLKKYCYKTQKVVRVNHPSDGTEGVQEAGNSSNDSDRSTDLSLLFPDFQFTQIGPMNPEKRSNPLDLMNFPRRFHYKTRKVVTMSSPSDDTKGVPGASNSSEDSDSSDHLTFGFGHVFYSDRSKDPKTQSPDSRARRIGQMNPERRSNPLDLMDMSKKYRSKPRKVVRIILPSDDTEEVPEAGNSLNDVPVADNSSNDSDRTIDTTSSNTTRTGCLPSRIGDITRSSRLCEIPHDAQYYHAVDYHTRKNRSFQDIERPKLQFYAAGTKTVISKGATRPDDPLPNRRVWSIFRDKPHPIINRPGTPKKTSEDAMGSLVQAPRMFLESPTLWLSMNRWMCSPKSEFDLLAGYVCPDAVKPRLEEDAARLFKKVRWEMTNDDLLVYFSELIERYRDKTVKNYPIYYTLLKRTCTSNPSPTTLNTGGTSSQLQLQLDRSELHCLTFALWRTVFNYTVPLIMDISLLVFPKKLP